MTVYINARFLTQQTSGVQRYAHAVLSAFDALVSNDADLRKRLGPIIAYHPATKHITRHPWKTIELRELPGGHGQMWEQFSLPKACKGGVLISLCTVGPVLKRDQILALHDANIYDIPAAFTLRYRMWHRLLRPILARRMAHLITVSGYSARRLSRILGVPSHRFTVIPNAASHLMDVTADRAALGKYQLRAGDYLLAVGNQSPNKNIARLIDAHGRAPDAPPLVVVGHHTKGVVGATVPASSRVHVLGRITDSELRALYEGAAAFVWPSLYEGFGIPPLEAMQLGVPVLSSHSSAMPEVLGNAARYFDAFDVEDMTRALDQFSTLTPTKRQELQNLGRERASKFNWDNSARLLLDLLLRSREFEQAGTSANDQVDIHNPT